MQSGLLHYFLADHLRTIEMQVVDQHAADERVRLEELQCRLQEQVGIYD